MRALKGQVSAAVLSPRVVKPGQKESPDLVRALGLVVACSQEDSCGPRSRSCAIRHPRGDAPSAFLPTPTPANRGHLVAAPSVVPAPGSLDLAPSLSVSSQPASLPESALLPRAPAGPPGGTSGLSRREQGASGGPGAAEWPCRLRPAENSPLRAAAPSPAALNLALPPPPALKAAARN